jgi:hypothetical protein
VAPLDDLRRIAPPPAEPTGRVPDFERARAELGFDLPGDYVALVGEWGAGEFDDFVGLNEPGHPNPNLELVREARGWEWAMREILDQGEQLAFPPEIEVGGLLAWGADANGDPCFWHVRSEDPASWVIVIQEARGPDWHLYDGGLVDFLVDFLEGRERVLVFPDNVPSEAPGFRRA